MTFVCTLYHMGQYHVQAVALGLRLVTECVTKIEFSYFSTKTYVVATQKNRLNETVLLSTQNIC